MNQLHIYLIFAGIGIAVLGALALLIVAFVHNKWWGIGSLLFPPALIVFGFKYFKKAAIPLIIILLGGCAVGSGFLMDWLRPTGVVRKTTTKEGKVTSLTGTKGEIAELLEKHKDTEKLILKDKEGVTDDALEVLKGNERIRELDLRGTEVTDKCLPILAALPNLKTLRLADTQITDEGFRKHLANLKTLQRVDASRTRIRKETLNNWKKAQPGRMAMGGT